MVSKNVSDRICGSAWKSVGILQRTEQLPPIKKEREGDGGMVGGSVRWMEGGRGRRERGEIHERERERGEIPNYNMFKRDVLCFSQWIL